MTSINTILPLLRQQSSQRPGDVVNTLSQILSRPAGGSQSGNLSNTISQVLTQVNQDIAAGNQERAQKNLSLLNTTLRRSFNPFASLDSSVRNSRDDKNDYLSSALSSFVTNQSLLGLIAAQKDLQPGDKTTIDLIASIFDPGGTDNTLSQGLVENLQNKLSSLGLGNSYTSTGANTSPLSALFSIFA